MTDLFQQEKVIPHLGIEATDEAAKAAEEFQRQEDIARNVFEESKVQDLDDDADNFITWQNSQQKVISDMASDFTILGIPYPIEPDTMAFWVGTGHQALDVWRGLKQIAGVDVLEEQANEEIMNQLYADPELGGAAEAGAIAGAVAEPLGLIAPGAKGKTLVQLMGKGALWGAGLMGLGYIDEDESRPGEAIKGAFFGSMVGPFYKAGEAGVAKIAEKFTKKDVDQYKTALYRYEVEMAERMLAKPNSRELLRESPVEAWEEVHRELADSFPEIVERAKEASKATGIKPKLGTALRNHELRVEEMRGLRPLDTIPPSQKTEFTNSVDKLTGLVSTRVKNISPFWFGKLRQFEANIKIRPEKYAQRRQDFADYFIPTSHTKRVKKVTQFSDKESRELNLLLINGKFEEAGKYILKNKGQKAFEAFKETEKLISELGDELLKYGVINKKISDYWPRVIAKNKIEEFVNVATKRGSLPKDTASRWKKRLNDLTKTSMEKRGFKLTDVEEAEAFQQFLLKEGGDFSTFIHAKGRKFQEVKPEWAEFYESPIEALDSYIHRAVKEIEMAKMFGVDAYAAGLKNAKDTKGLFNLNETLSYLEKNKWLQNMDEADIQELREILRIRFGKGMVGTGNATKWYKFIIHNSLLANPISAITQFGDASVAAYRLGLSNAVKAAVTNVTEGAPVAMKELGISMDRFAEFEDLAGQLGKLGSKEVPLGVITDKMLRWSGFSSVDKFGKELVLTSALNKAGKAVSKPFSKEYEAFANKYKNILGPKDFHKLADDLAKYQKNPSPENLTDDIRVYLFNELSDSQPISLSEMPAPYLNSDAGKFMYTLKTFMMKQLDILRNDGVSKIGYGVKNKDARAIEEGMGNIAKYVMIVGTGNMAVDEIKRQIQGKEGEVLQTLDEDAQFVLTANILQHIGKNVLRTFGVTGYTLGAFETQGVEGAATELLFPPIPALNEVLDGFQNDWGADDVDKLARYFPLIGRFLASGEVQVPFTTIEGEVPKISEILGVRDVPKYAEGGLVSTDETEEMASGVQPAEDPITYHDIQSLGTQLYETAKKNVEELQDFESLKNFPDPEVFLEKLKNPQTTQEVLDALFGGAGVGGGMAAYIRGPKAFTIEAGSKGEEIYDSFQKYKTLRSEGKTNSEAYKETGWWVDKDGVPRQEVIDPPNLRVELGIDPSKTSAPSYHRLGEVLDHPPLYEDYPSLYNVEVRVQDLPGNTGGQVDSIGGSPVITLNKKLWGKGRDERATATLLHEIQHVIQTKEGMTQGANVNYLKSILTPEELDAFKDLVLSVKENPNLVPKDKVSMFNSFFESWRKTAPNTMLKPSKRYTQYKGKMGEVEARAVAGRFMDRVYKDQVEKNIAKLEKDLADPNLPAELKGKLERKLKIEQEALSSVDEMLKLHFTKYRDEILTHKNPLTGELKREKGEPKLPVEELERE